MGKEQFINEILNSTNGISRVNPNDSLYLKIEQKIQRESESSQLSIWFVAAFILVFFSLNIILLQTNSFSKKSVSSFALELNKSNQLYK